MGCRPPVALALTDSACLICGEIVEDESHGDRGDDSDISVHAHENCVDLQIRSNSERFGEYEPIELIGDRAVGQLYQVYERKTRRIWALKRLTGVSRSNHFESDLQQLLAIRHPNLIKCVQGDVDQNGVPFLVMEFARAGNIADFVDRGDCSPRRALQLIDEVLEALNFLHALGKSHGNLHPRSIVIQREVRGSGVRSRAKLVDLGITSRLRDEIIAVDASQWRPPDRGLAAPDPQDDVYSVAALLSCLLDNLRRRR
jgi:serine/threonine protein kinase